MTSPPSSPNPAPRARPLTERLGLAPDDLPAGGLWYPEEDVLLCLLDQIEARRPRRVVSLGGGIAVVVMARVLGWDSELVMVEADPQMLAFTQDLLAELGADCKVRFLEAELQEYDKHNMWYWRGVLDELPAQIDLLFIDGPGHFAGRMPRWPAGPELFSRLQPGGIAILDDGKRVKEKKALKRWAEDFPDLKQEKTKTSGGAVILRAREG